jgi:hypothetical protein
VKAKAKRRESVRPRSAAPLDEPSVRGRGHSVSVRPLAAARLREHARCVEQGLRRVSRHIRVRCWWFVGLRPLGSASVRAR